MRDIAAKAGVHVTTVSLALRNHHSLPVATRERLQALALEMGYRPDPMLSALGAYRQASRPINSGRVVAYLTFLNTPDIEHHGFTTRFFFEGCQARCAELGYRLERVWMREPKISVERWNKILRTRNYAGLIAAELPGGRGHLRLDWSQFVAVKIEQALVWPRLHAIGNNQHQCVQLAMRQGRRLGYSRMGLAISQANNEQVNRFWSGGFWAEQQAYPEKDRVNPHLPRELTLASFRQWLDHERPDLVLSNEAEIPDWLNELGYRVPKDIGYLSLDLGDQKAKRAGIQQDHFGVGAASINQLAVLIQHNDRGIPAVPHLTLLEGKWVDGDTVCRQG